MNATAAVTEEQTLAILSDLATIIGGPSAPQTAYDLVRYFDFDLSRLLQAEAGEIASVPGIGKAIAARIVAALNLRLAVDVMSAPSVITSPEDAFLHFADLARLHQETLRILVLNTRHGVLDRHDLYKGTINTLVWQSREVFRHVLLSDGTAVILGHNHPSGDARPSSDDLRATAELVRAGNLLGIIVLDHIIVAGRRFVSLRRDYRQNCGFSQPCGDSYLRCPDSQ